MTRSEERCKRVMLAIVWAGERLFLIGLFACLISNILGKPL